MRGNISKNKNGQGEMIQTVERHDYDDLDTLTDVGVYAVRMPFDNVSSLCYIFVSVQESEGMDDSNRAYITNTYSQFLMGSDALKSRSKTIKTYKDDETQSVGNWSAWKTTEGAITKTVINYDAIDSYCDCGVYFVEGRTDQISEGSAETLVVSSAGRVFCQYYFYCDGRVEYRQQQYGSWSEWKSVGTTSYNDLTDKPNLSKVATTGNYEDLSDKPTIVGDLSGSVDDNAIPTGRAVQRCVGDSAKEVVTFLEAQLKAKANTSDLSTVATSGSYNDLLNQPITALEYYPSQDMIDAMTHGAYVYRSQTHTVPSIMVVAGMRYDEIIDELGIKKYFCRQYIIDSYSGFQARERIVCEDSSYETGWENIPISDDLATKKQISDILDGKSIVGKAENDDEGNKIRDTYATKEELKSVGGGVGVITATDDGRGNVTISFG